MDDGSLDRLCQLTGLPKPASIVLLPEHWSSENAAHLGGLRRMELYGPPGTPEGRRRGGLAAQVILHNRSTPGGRWKLRKPILSPPRNEDLAEFMGILFGDGCIRNTWQVAVSFNQHGDRPYAEFIGKVIRQLFGLGATYCIRSSSADLIVSSTALVSFVKEQGFPAGSKCETLTEVPRWIVHTHNLRLACLRGLMDTDGCVFRHRYRVHGKNYAYPKLAFAAAIPCLIQFVAESFRILGLAAHVRQHGQRVFIDGQQSVARYFEVVGTHNPRYQQRFEAYTRESGER